MKICKNVFLVPYKIKSHSESDHDNFPKKSNKRKKIIQIQKLNCYAKRNRKLRERLKKLVWNKIEGMWNYGVPREPRVIRNRYSCKEIQKIL